MGIAGNSSAVGLCDLGSLHYNVMLRRNMDCQRVHILVTDNPSIFTAFESALSPSTILPVIHFVPLLFMNA